MSKRIGLCPRVRVEGGGRGVVSQAGAVLLVETVRKAGLDAAISAALAPWRKPRVVHDPGKVLLDVALGVALGGDCLADVAVLRAEPDVFGPVASDPAVSRLIDTLAAAGPKSLTEIRSARAEVRPQAWELAGANSPAADGSVIVDIDGDHIGTAQLALAQLPRHLRRGHKTLIRTDSAGGTHAFVDWLSRRGRWLSYSVGMTITDAVYQAVLKRAAPCIQHPVGFLD